MTGHLAFRILALAAIALLFGACDDYSEAFDPLEMPDVPEQPGFGANTDFGDTPEGALSERLDEVFDPYHMGDDIVYEGSIYQRMDQILAGAYEHYGYDLAKLAALREPNPLSEQQFFDYLTETGQHNIIDEQTGDEYRPYEWLQRRLGMTAGSAHSLALDQFDESYKNNFMNFEPNYLAAMYDGNFAHVFQARQVLRQRLADLYGDDAAAMHEYLDSLEPVGTE